MTSDQERLQRLGNARSWLANAIPFVGFLCMRLRFSFRNEGHLAEIHPDGRLQLTRRRFDRLNDREIRGLLTHEILHCALLHHERGRTRLEKRSGVSLWQVAADIAVNHLAEAFIKTCQKRGCQLPADSIKVPAKYAGEATEVIYNDLIGLGDEQLPAGWTGIGQDLGFSASPDAAEEADWSSLAVQAAQIHEACQGRGTLPSGASALIQTTIVPSVPWRQRLSRWVGDHLPLQEYTYARPSRRSQGAELYLPGILKEAGVPKFVVIWDSSGSMEGFKELVLSYVVQLASEHDLPVRVIVCDAAVQADVTIQPGQVDFDLPGGGGSDFTPAFELLDEEAYTGVVIAVTDGFIGIPETQPPLLKGCLWVIGEQHHPPRADTSWGEVLRVPMTELRGSRRGSAS